MVSMSDLKNFVLPEQKLKQNTNQIRRIYETSDFKLRKSKTKECFVNTIQNTITLLFIFVNWYAAKKLQFISNPFISNYAL